MTTYRLNLEAAQFPLLSYYFGPSVVIRTKSDNDYIVTDAYTGNAIANAEVGIAQPLYMHNVMPSSYGYESVGYRTEVRPAAGLAATGAYNRITLLRNRAEQRHYMSTSPGNRSLLYDKDYGWIGANISGPAGLPTNAPITTGYVNGVTYVCFEHEGIYEYNTETRTLQPVALKGINAYAVKGITANANSLIAYDDRTIYYSSFVDATDFTPGLTSSAASANPQTIRGAITVCLPINNGFVIYTTHNAVAALWTGDTSYPWTFREIPGSAGVLSSEHVSHESNYENHFAWTTSGLQIISAQGAAPFAVELTDYIAKRYFEQWDLLNWEQAGPLPTFSGRGQVAAATAKKHWPCDYTTGGVLTQFPLDVSARVKLNYVGSRFLAISIGTPNTLRIIIVYDLALKRWGKLMIDHTDVFEYSPPGGAPPEPLRSFGILQKDGTILTVDRDVIAQHTDSVFLFGRIALARDADTSIRNFKIATGPYDNFGVKLYAAGKARNIVTHQDLHPVDYTPGDLTRTYYPDNTVAHEFLLGLTGKFHLAGLEMNLDSHKRMG